jgi:Holliday junction DNA helicase RuvA
MIEYIKGTVAYLEPTIAVIEAHGVGYELNISLIDYTTLQGMAEAKLYVHESIREDAHVLFGFLTREARAMFRLLIGVSGVGPNTARLILSSLTVSDLQGAIASENDSMLKAVKGIGGKTAQRIIVDLKDKIKATEIPLNTNMTSDSHAYEETLAALVTLGFTQQASQKVLKKIFSENPAISLEQAIKQALKQL